MYELSHKKSKKEKIVEILYSVIVWMIPFLYITVFPWILVQVKFLARNEIPFGPNASTFYYNLSVFILPMAIGLIMGLSFCFLGVGVKRNKNKFILVGVIVGVLYALYILLSYGVYFNISIPIFNKGVQLGMYTGLKEPSLILGLYSILLYQNIKRLRMKNHKKFKRIK
jgi:hypothetical protein